MLRSTKTRRLLVGASLIVLAIGLAGCGTLAKAVAAREVPTVEEESEDWVIVFFEFSGDDTEIDVMDALLATEIELDAALVEQGLGWIDGNEVGQGSYDLYFNGDDHDEMWGVLKPILATAPMKWTRVELRDSLEGPATVELTSKKE